MTLDAAIKHCDEVSKSASCEECKNQHKQLKEWLIELKNFKNTQPYKFEELHEGMWVWHDKRKRCFRLTDAFIRVGTKYYRWLDISSGKLVQERFVEGQLFPLTKGMQYQGKEQ